VTGRPHPPAAAHSSHRLRRRPEDDVRGAAPCRPEDDICGAAPCRPEDDICGAAPCRPSTLRWRGGEGERFERFLEVVEAAQACRRCPRMEGRTRALGPGNGPLDATVLFVAEAPGRLGADRTGVPLSGDQTGRNFDALLSGAGIERSRVFVTNAVLCNPRKPDGRNDRPRAGELQNCSLHLRALIDLLDPPWVVSLGRAALDAVCLIEPHDRVLACHVGTAVPWYGRLLMPLYHPGPRALIRRTFAQQAADYAALAALVAR
jgi:uracil-DNA glycosylase